MIVTGFDIETTGLEQEKGHRIIEVAAVFCDLDSGSVLGRYAQRINPERPIDPKAQAVHGISFEDVSSCPTWDAVAPKISVLLNKSDIVVAHNGIGFDMPFVAGEFARVGIQTPKVEVLDTMLDGRWATPMGKVPNLGELCFACGVEYDPSKAHSALYDVEVMLAAFFAARKKGFFKIKEAR